MDTNKYVNAEHIELLVDDTGDPLTALIDKEEENENINHYRMAAQRFISIMTLAMAFIMESSNKELATIAVAYALELSDITEGKSQREMARELGLSSGTISWNVAKFKSYAGITL